MRRFLAVLFLLTAAADARAVTIDWTPVGNPRNPVDKYYPVNGLGAVGYVFDIDKYDVTNSQYAEFLNTKDPTGANPHDIYNPGMAEDRGIYYNPARPLAASTAPILAMTTIR